MGTPRDPRSNRFQGLSRLDPRWRSSRLRAIGANPEDSSYTEGGPRAGVPAPLEDSSLSLKASGSQSARGHLEILAHRSGHPMADGGGLLVRDVAAGDGVTEYLGQDGYQLITGWDGSLRYDTTGTGARHAAPILRLLSGDVLTVEYNEATVHEVWRMDSTSGSWTNTTTLNLLPGVPDSDPDPALLQLPSGRVVYFYVDRLSKQVHGVSSDDDGSTWEDYAKACLSESASEKISGLSVAYSRGVVLLFTTEETGGTSPGTGQQWASHDLGCTFQRVGSGWFGASSPQERPAHVNLIGLPSGAFLMCYWHIGSGGAGTEVYSVRQLSPFSPGYTTSRLDLYTTANAPAFADSSLAAWEDEDGLLYLLCELESGTSAYTQLLRSEDGGSNWHAYKSPTFSSPTTPGAQRLHAYRAASTGGRTYLATRMYGSGAHDRSLFVVSLGGHTRATVPTVDDGSAEFGGLSYLGWGRELTGDVRFGGCYLPFTDPAAMGWTAVGVGTAQIVADARWRIASVANSRYYLQTSATNKDTNTACAAGFIVRVVSGGSLSASQITLQVKISDYHQPGPTNATFVNDVVIYFTTTGFRVYDNTASAQIGGDVTYDLTKDTYVQVAMRGGATNGEVAVWYGRPGVPARRLLLAALSSSVTSNHAGDPTAPCKILWGNVTSATATSEWSLVGWNFYAAPFQPDQATNFVSSWDNPTDLRPRDLPTRGSLLLDGVKIQATDGPAKMGEKWDIKARYDHPIEALDPRLSPSPGTPWRSKEDNVLERIVWDLEGGLFTDAFMGNHALVFALLGTNIKTAHLKGWNVGGASWDTLLTFDASHGASGLKWSRSGSTVRPDNAQTSRAGKYLWRHQHAGDTFDLGGEDPLQKIQTNTEGAWGTDGTGTAKVKQPTLWLEKDHLEAGLSSTGTGAIWARDFASILREYDGIYQRFALEIPAQHTAEGYYQIGTFFAGDVLVFGQQYDLGWIKTTAWNTDVEQRDDGSRSARTLGPPRRAVQFAWVETAVQTWMEQAENPDPDYLRSRPGSGGFPVASRGDVLRAFEGLLGQSEGPVEPVLFLPRIPQQSAGGGDPPSQVTDRRLLLYGRISTTPRRENLAARTGEGVDETERLNRMTIEEEV